MTYRELYEKAECQLEKGKITVGEFDEMTKPLDEEPRPHGEWETCIDPEYCKCSYCGNVVMLEESVRFHFCPNCGADMRKEGDPNE